MIMFVLPILFRFNFLILFAVKQNDVQLICLSPFYAGIRPTFCAAYVEEQARRNLGETVDELPNIKLNKTLAAFSFTQ